MRLRAYGGGNLWLKIRFEDVPSEARTSSHVRFRLKPMLLGALRPQRPARTPSSVDLASGAAAQNFASFSHP